MELMGSWDLDAAVPEAQIMNQNGHFTGEGSPCEFSKGHSHFSVRNSM